MVLRLTGLAQVFELFSSHSPHFILTLSFLSSLILFLSVNVCGGYIGVQYLSIYLFQVCLYRSIYESVPVSIFFQEDYFPLSNGFHYDMSKNYRFTYIIHGGVLSVMVIVISKLKWRPEFKSWTRLFTFQFSLIPLTKAWIHFFFYPACN